MLIFYYHDLEGAMCHLHLQKGKPAQCGLGVMTRLLPSLDLVESVS